MRAISQLDGVTFFKIDDTDGRGLKTENAKRIVPVHPELVRLGFLSFVAEARRSGRQRVFDDLKPDSLGRIATMPSKRLNRYLKNIGVKTSPRLCVHSFRHTFIDCLRTAGFRDTTIATIVGHAGPERLATGGYGQEDERIPMQTRVKMIDALKYPGLDLSALYPATPKPTLTENARPTALSAEP